MTYEMYLYIFYGGAILAVLMLITTVLLFVLLKIPTVIGDLTGANARKAIEKIRNQAENSTDNGSYPAYMTSSREKLTDKISQSGRIIKNPTKDTGVMMNTAKISTTDLMADNQTTVLEQSGNETVVLNNNPPAMETTVLSQESAQAVYAIEYEITFIHTNEVIS